MKQVKTKHGNWKALPTAQDRFVEKHGWKVFATAHLMYEEMAISSDSAKMAARTYYKEPHVATSGDTFPKGPGRKEVAVIFEDSNGTRHTYQLSESDLLSDSEARQWLRLSTENFDPDSWPEWMEEAIEELDSLL